MTVASRLLLLGRAPLLQPEGEGLGQQGLAIDTVEQTDAGDADLHGGEEMGRIFPELEGDGGGAAPFARHFGETCLACRHDGDFRHGEDAIEQNQSKQDQYFHTAAALPIEKTAGSVMNLRALRL